MSCKLFLIVGIAVLIFACVPSEKQTYQIQYSEKSAIEGKGLRCTFAIHPLHNPRRLFTLYQPLIDIINKQVPELNLKLVASRDYATFEKKLYAGCFDFALPNPLQTLKSQKHGYRIVGKMGDDENFRGIIIVRRDSGFKEVKDLKNRALSFPAPSALAATMLPKYYLQSRGLDLSNNDLKYVGSQESAIMNVYMNKTAAAGTWPLPWKLWLQAHPELGEALEVKWMTPSLINNGIVVREDVSDEYVEQVLRVLFDLPNHISGREILMEIGISEFEQASSATYAPVQSFLDAYDKLFSADTAQRDMKHE